MSKIKCKDTKQQKAIIVIILEWQRTVIINNREENDTDSSNQWKTLRAFYFEYSNHYTGNEMLWYHVYCIWKLGTDSRFPISPAFNSRFTWNA